MPNRTQSMLRARIRRLLKSPEPDVVNSGCELMRSLIQDPALLFIPRELSEETALSNEGVLILGEELKKRVRAPSQVFVALHVLDMLALIPAGGELNFAGTEQAHSMDAAPCMCDQLSDWSL